MREDRTSRRTDETVVGKQACTCACRACAVSCVRNVRVCATVCMLHVPASPPEGRFSSLRSQSTSRKEPESDVCVRAHARKGCQQRKNTLPQQTVHCDTNVKRAAADTDAAAHTTQRDKHTPRSTDTATGSSSRTTRSSSCTGGTCTLGSTCTLSCRPAVLGCAGSCAARGRGVGNVACV